MTKNNPNDEISKLQQRLALLKEEYVKLQKHCEAIEKDRAKLRATTSAQNGSDGEEQSFVANILKAVASMLKKSDYSDMKVILEGDEQIPAHKFVFNARSTQWNLNTECTLNWSHLPNDVGHAILEWIYNDQISLLDKNDVFKLALLKASKTFDLPQLLVVCERALIASVHIKNCIKLYTTAEEIEAKELKDHCSQLISTHWDDFTSEDFEHMTAPLLFNMFKTKTKYPLHSAIRLKREDVVFLYLIEFNQQLSVKLNQVDDHGILPLDIALKTRQEELAKNLVEHHVNINQMDDNGAFLLHLAIDRGDAFAATFLLDNGAQVNVKRRFDDCTPLHLTSGHPQLRDIAEKLLLKGASFTDTNVDGMTPIHLAIAKKNEPIFELLLKRGSPLDCQCEEGYPPLWYALQEMEEEDEGFAMAKNLIDSGASTNIICDSLNGNSLLHCLLKSNNEKGALFLLENSQEIDVNTTNKIGQSPLHMTAQKGFTKLTQRLLAKGSNPDLQTVLKESESSDYRHTPLHLAILYKQLDVIQVILNNETKPNLNMKNSAGMTPLALSMSEDLHQVATLLIQFGADVNVTDALGNTLLHLAISDCNCDAALFLLTNGSDVNRRTKSNQTCLELAIEKNLDQVVEALCRLGADMNKAGAGGDPPLWLAMEKDPDLASILVRYGVDTDAWNEGPDGCHQTLLHRAIDENREDLAAFLIRCGCDLNSARKIGPDGRGGDEAHDLASPLHLCCQWGLELVVQALLEHGANKNSKDVEGKTPLHCAIENGHQPIINMLLEQNGLDLSCRDKLGSTPFATAMSMKNNKAAQKILELEPQAAEQYDSRGRNFLHTAILKCDLESVLFLLSINVKVHSRTQDQHSLTPLLLAVQKGHAMMVRNLILAGASVHDKTAGQQTALQLAAEANLAEVCSILLSERIDFAAVDSRGNNALHIAVKEGHLEVVRVLLTESQIDAEAVNFKGRNPLHILANFGSDNAVAIFDLFLECMPDYPLDKTDADGSTALLLAYMKGNGAMCRSLVKAGAKLGTLNSNGVSIFNCQVATKALLYRLLDSLSQEPKWGEGDTCEECSTKFGITTRKHHCRHCGRLLCSKCSSKEMPIVKYNLSKAARVCDTCAEVITVGPSNPFA